jgi:lysophospholipase L1-like esterase
VVLVLVLVEKAMEWLDYEYRPLTIAARDDRRDTLPFREEHFAFDRRLLWRPRAGFRIFNHQGFRGPEVSAERAPGETRIFTLGDSNTLGWRGAEGANWPAMVGELFGPPVQVINAGVWGNSSFQGVWRLEDILPHDPDVLTVSFGSNDAHRVRVSDAERSGAGPWTSWLKGRLEDYRLGRVLLGAIDRLGAAGAARTVPRVGLASYRANLRRIAATARAHGARVVFLTRPYIGAPESADSWRVAAPDYNAATIEVAVELGLPTVDLYTIFRHRDALFADESHFTPEGHAIAARLVYEELRPLVQGAVER